MTIHLPEVIKTYVTASNAHNVADILGCFTDGAVVHDEAEAFGGKKAIEGWLVKTIEKYRFQFKPLTVKEQDGKVIVGIEVSGTFKGSPINLDYHFTLQSGKISCLSID